MLITAFDGLLKYMTNLILPKRPLKWRSINTANTSFMRHVASMKGYEEILRTAGYTEKDGNSLTFPESVEEPDQAKLSVLAAELLMAKLEVKQIKRETPKPAKQGIATVGQSTSRHCMLTLDNRFLLRERASLTSGVDKGISQHTLVIIIIANIHKLQ